MAAGLIKSIILTLHFSLPLKDPVLIFSVVLFIILMAPIILRKFRIPSIVGLIIAGVIVGPYGVNLLAFDSSIELFGMVGLLYLMFLAGLELDMNDFRKYRYKSIIFGFLTFLIPFGLGFPVCYYIFHFNVMASALIASMFATHTLVAYPIASKLGITKNEAITISVGATIIADTLVLLLLAVITGANAGTLDQAFWVRLGISILAFVVIVFVTFPPIGRWFFKNIKEDNTSQYIFVLAMVFLAGLLAEVAGMEAIIGAFMAGLALNRLIPHVSPLMNRIEFVGNALFIPFFLLSVGMRVDLRVFTKGAGVLILAGVLLLIAFAGKWIAAWAVQVIFKYSALQRKVLFGLTSARAAATLAVILVGYQTGIINEDILNATIILILITCLVSSFVTEKGGRELALAEKDALPVKDETRERILVPISNPQTIEQLVDFSVMLRNKKQKEPIYALTVVRDDEEAAVKVQVSKKMLESVIKHAAATDTEVEILTRVDLSVTSGITRSVKEVDATDLILGWSSKVRTTDRLFGSKLVNILDNVWQTVYVCHFIQPLNVNKKMIVVLPAYAEYEIGFIHIIHKIRTLVIEMGVTLSISCTEKTREIIDREWSKNKSSVAIRYLDTEYQHNYFSLSRFITPNDLLVTVSARKGTVSYDLSMDSLLPKMHRYFKENNFMLIYPKQHAVVMKETIMQPQDVTLAPIQEQLGNLTRLGKTMRRMLRMKKRDEMKKEDNATAPDDTPQEEWEDDLEEKVE